MAETVNRFQRVGKVKTIKGSILSPHNAGLRLVLSVTNLSGKADNPMVTLLDKKWRQVKQDVKGWYANKTGAYKLGAVNTSAVQSDTWVVHMLCQNENQEVNLPALEACLKEVAKVALYEQATVHFSSVLATMIPEVVDLLNEVVVKNGVSVYLYDEPSA